MHTDTLATTIATSTQHHAPEARQGMMELLLLLLAMLWTDNAGEGGEGFEGGSPQRSTAFSGAPNRGEVARRRKMRGGGRWEDEQNALFHTHLACATAASAIAWPPMRRCLHLQAHCRQGLLPLPSPPHPLPHRTLARSHPLPHPEERMHADTHACTPTQGVNTIPGGKGKCAWKARGFQSDACVHVGILAADYKPHIH